MVRLYPSLYGVDGFVPTCRAAGIRIDRGVRFPAIPASLSEQPFFYAVTNEEYATQIARDGNTKGEVSTHLLARQGCLRLNLGSDVFKHLWYGFGKDGIATCAMRPINRCR